MADLLEGLSAQAEDAVVALPLSDETRKRPRAPAPAPAAPLQAGALPDLMERTKEEEKEEKEKDAAKKREEEASSWLAVPALFRVPDAPSRSSNNSKSAQQQQQEKAAQQQAAQQQAEQQQHRKQHKVRVSVGPPSVSTEEIVIVRPCAIRYTFLPKDPADN